MHQASSGTTTHDLVGAVCVAYSGAAGKIDVALPRLREAVAALERHHGADSNDARGPRKYLGEVLRMAGRCEEAEALHRRSLDLERRLFGSEDTIASASTKHQIALDILESGRPERLAEARSFASESLAFSAPIRRRPAAWARSWPPRAGSPPRKATGRGPGRRSRKRWRCSRPPAETTHPPRGPPAGRSRPWRDRNVPSPIAASLAPLDPVRRT
jgi:hypothetical protein